MRVSCTAYTGAAEACSALPARCELAHCFLASTHSATVSTLVLATAYTRIPLNSLRNQA